MIVPSSGKSCRVCFLGFNSDIDHGPHKEIKNDSFLRAIPPAPKSLHRGVQLHWDSHQGALRLQMKKRQPEAEVGLRFKVLIMAPRIETYQDCFVRGLLVMSPGAV